MKGEARAGGLLQLDQPVRQPGVREVLVRMKSASVCGTDVAIYDWPAWVAPRVRVPVTLGHEGIGVVEAVGPGVTRVKVGDRVSVESHIFCESCYTCMSGKPHLCLNLTYVGMHIDGLFAECAVLPEQVLFPLPAGFPDDLGALLEPFGLAVRAAKAGNGATGRSVLITGCGPLGLMAALAARHFGAYTVVASEINPARVEFARKHSTVLGIDRVIDVSQEDPVQVVRDLTGGRGADLWIDFAGTGSALQQGFAATVMGGEAHLFAASNQVTLDLTQFVLKEITALSFHGRLIYETWFDSIQLAPKVEEGLKRLVTHVLPLQRYEEAFQLMKSGQSQKVVFDIEGSANHRS